MKIAPTGVWINCEDVLLGVGRILSLHVEDVRIAQRCPYCRKQIPEKQRRKNISLKWR